MCNPYVRVQTHYNQYTIRNITNYSQIMIEVMKKTLNRESQPKHVFTRKLKSLYINHRKYH